MTRNEINDKQRVVHQSIELLWLLPVSNAFQSHSRNLALAEQYRKLAYLAEEIPDDLPQPIEPTPTREPPKTEFTFWNLDLKKIDALLHQNTQVTQ